MTLSSVAEFKGLLHLAEFQLISSSGLDTNALVLHDNACSNSLVASNLADRLGLHGIPLKLIVEGVNTEEVLDTSVVKLTMKPS